MKIYVLSSLLLDNRTPVKKAIALLPKQKRSLISPQKSARRSYISKAIALPHLPSSKRSQQRKYC
ncbi:MAG: hypothetical protein KME31_20460 [Tolypothrix carrinoi HA7290-LM1]|nr:hypothetical protein [Tolypothrix carrinoi HA7290-LM1]